MKKFSKMLCVVMAVLLSVSASIMAACDSHKHTFGDKWTSDEEGHWHPATCDHKDVKGDFAKHEFDDSGRCKVCGYPQSDKPEDPVHDHTYTTSWWHDETNHWHAATCAHTDMKSDLDAHSYNKFGRCTVCGYQNDDSITYNDSITEEQWRTAVADLVKAKSYTRIDDYFRIGSAFDCHRVLAGDGTRVQETITTADGQELVTEYSPKGYRAEYINKRLYSLTENRSYLASYDEYFVNEVTPVAEVVSGLYSSAKFDGETQSYKLQFGSVKLQLWFVDNGIYSLAYDSGVNGDASIYLTAIGNTYLDFLSEHVHELSTDYTTSSMYHWQRVCCQDHSDEIVDKQPHSFDGDGKCTVCGYVKSTASGSVTEEQWNDAMSFKGINNFAMLPNDSQSDGAFYWRVTSYGIHGAGNTEFYKTENGKVYSYTVDSEGNATRAECKPMSYYSDRIAAFERIYELLSLVGKYGDFTFDATVGSYKAKDIDIVRWGTLFNGDGTLEHSVHHYDAVEVIFEGTELKEISLGNSGGFSIRYTFGDVSIDYPDVG